MASDEAFVSMNTIKETPAQWKKLLHDVLVMMQQLALQTFFWLCYALIWGGMNLYY